MPTAHGYHIWAEKFKEELAKTMKDRVDVQIFPNGQLGKETEYLEGMRMGTLDASILGRHGQVDIRLEVLNFPMIYRDQKHQDVILRQNSKLQQDLDNIFYEKGYKCLGWGVLGDRHVTTKDRAVRKASDLKGLDIRIPNVPVFLAAFKAWGANPTPLDFTEVYSALQQGVIKAQENPPEIIYTSRFYEVQKYLCLTAHSDMPCQFLVGRNYWEKLPKDVQEAMMKAATTARDYHVKVVREANAKLVDELEKKGMIIIRDVDRKSFVPGAEEAYRQFEDKIGKDLIRRVQEAK
jgi:tripartite ATP-independent transporter DctP family solute receptor